MSEDIIVRNDNGSNQQVVYSNQSELDIEKNSIKCMLIGQAKRELLRVAKLTEVLDKLQDRYADKIIQFMNENDDDTAVAYLPQMIETISKCIERSNNIVSRVVNDKEVMNVMLINTGDVNISSDNSKGSRDVIETVLSDPAQRNKVREAVNRAIIALSQEESSNQT